MIGSIPLNSASEVFEFLGRRLGDLASRYPDGETGPRINWVRWQRHVFDDNVGMELTDTRKLAGFNDTIPRPFYRLKEGANLDHFGFKSLGYAQKAIESYADFRQLKAAGVIPNRVKFQVSLPSPTSLLTVFVQLEDRAAVEPMMEAAFAREIEEMATHIPHGELAVQWDVCHEIVGHDGGIELHFGDVLENASTRVCRLVDYVPRDIEVGIHLCYGDPGHRHIVNPQDTRTTVEFSKRIAHGANRHVDFIHIPILREWKAGKYYAPLADLDLPNETAVYLGLVHFTDGIEGTRERVGLARKVVPSFGVATECGFGRRDPSTLAGLVDIHREVATTLS